MSFNFSDLKDLDFQELSDIESEAVVGGKLFGCITGAVIGGLASGPVGGYIGCKIYSSVEDKIDYS